MHSHEHYEEGADWGRSRRGSRGGWYGPPWARAAAAAPGDGPDRVWFGGPFGPGPGAGPWGGGRGRGRAAGWPWGRARRGDVRSAILVLLAERPMHGYEIIGELSDRTEGLWRPSAGSIYPTLQLLEDEGLVSAQTDDSAGKKRYALTDEGQKVAAELAKGPAPWDQMAAGAPAGARDLHHAVMKLMPVVGQVAMIGGAQEYGEAVKVLEDARRRLYAILAGEQTKAGEAGGTAGPTPQ